MSFENSTNKAWYLIFTKPRMEDVAQENLQRQSYQVYLPKILVNRRVRGRYNKKVQPMFHRYLFIRLDTIYDNWMPIRSTMGVSHLVRFGGIPAKVPDTFIRHLINKKDEFGYNCIEDRILTPGERVEILDGPMNGYIGIFESYSSAERVQILLDIVGQYTRVNIDRHTIQLAV